MIIFAMVHHTRILRSHNSRKTLDGKTLIQKLPETYGGKFKILVRNKIIENAQQLTKSLKLQK